MQLKIQDFMSGQEQTETWWSEIYAIVYPNSYLYRQILMYK